MHTFLGFLRGSVRRLFSTRELVSRELVSRELLLCCILLLFLAACGSDAGSGPGSDITGPDDDDNDTPIGLISYSSNVAQIFHASCAGSGCHINAAKSGVNLTNYSTVMASRGEQYGSLIIVPGNAAASPLINKLSSNPQFGIRMPDGKPALTSAQISTISTWINNGAPNN